MNKGEELIYSHVIYSHVFTYLIHEGFTQAQSEEAGAQAVRFYRKNTPHKKAIDRAIKECKKAHKKRR